MDLEVERTEAAQSFREQLTSISSEVERELAILQRRYGSSFGVTEDVSGDRLVSFRFEPTDPDLRRKWKMTDRPPLNLLLTFTLSIQYPDDSVRLKLGRDDDLSFHIHRCIECGVKKYSQSIRGKPQLRRIVHWIDQNLSGLIEIGTELEHIERTKAKERHEQAVVSQSVEKVAQADEREKPVEEKPVFPDVCPGQWTKEMQARLELGLRKSGHLKDVGEKFTFISKMVKDKTPAECYARYQELRRKVLERQGVTVVLKSAKSEDDEEEKEPVKLDPVQVARRGFEIKFQQLVIKKIGILKVMAAVVQVSCTRCDKRVTVTLSAGKGVMLICECRMEQVVRLRPALAHAHSDVMGYFDLERCEVIDILNINATLNCDNCFSDLLIKGLKRGVRTESCRKCFAEMYTSFEGFIIEKLGGRSVHVDTETAVDTNKKKRKKQIFSVGSPLPKNGVCKHYRNSKRWFRYPCCQTAYPCEKCHDDASDHKYEWANRHLCGACSKEQNVSQKICIKCGTEFLRGKSAFWEGGKGCRNKNAMSRNAKQKFRGMNKTISKKAWAKKTS